MKELKTILCLSVCLAFGACSHNTGRARLAPVPEMLVAEGSAAYNVKDLGATRAAASLDAQKNAVRRIAELFMDDSSRAENYAALEAGLLKTPQLYVAKYKVVSEGSDGTLYRESVKVWVYMDKIASALGGLSLTGAQGFKPRAALVSRETGKGSVFSSAFRNAISKNSVLDIEDFPFTLNSPADAGDEALLKAASEAGADLLLSAKAEASASGGGMNMGFFPSRADASVKVYDVRAGKELFAVAKQGSAIDSSEAASFSKALAAAGELLAKETALKAERLLKAEATVRIKVWGLNGIDSLEKLKSHLSGLEIKALRLESYLNGEAVFSVVPNRFDTQELASAALRGDPLLGLALEGVSPQEIVFTTK
ncbi:MAG: hypothetical protein A2016_08240 [Elusimicrobia bacterium GWF2_62_30]|nr:MAG: hypothetical protein A2016_08240 [Elusimicrobia bacterium GWF2_62_30]